MILGFVKAFLTITAVLLILAVVLIMGFCYYQESMKQRQRAERNKIRRDHLNYLRNYNPKV